MSRPPRITLYTSRNCPHCRRLEQWLRRHQLPFRRLEVDRNPRALRQLQRLGGRAVPVLVVGDEVWLQPDPKQLTRLAKG